MPYNEVYVIDDDYIYSFVAFKILEKSNICKKVSIFNDGTKAINHLKSLPPNKYPSAIFLDIIMPTMNGKEFYEALKSLPAAEKITLFIHSGTMNERELQPFRDANIKIFQKPLNMEEVKKLL
ncbi:response regulator [Cytophagaceae bacterium ABcell3]|nr:response regulator [Cytophagaceae bacterium ABcell3]